MVSGHYGSPDIGFHGARREPGVFHGAQSWLSADICRCLLSGACLCSPGALLKRLVWLRMYLLCVRVTVRQPLCVLAGTGQAGSSPRLGVGSRPFL